MCIAFVTPSVQYWQLLIVLFSLQNVYLFKKFIKGEFILRQQLITIYLLTSNNY